MFYLHLLPPSKAVKTHGIYLFEMEKTPQQVENSYELCVRKLFYLRLLS